MYHFSGDSWGLVGRKVLDLRGPWNPLSLSTQQVFLSFLSSTSLQLCSQWIRQSLMTSTGNLPHTPGFVLEAERDTTTSQLNS